MSSGDRTFEELEAGVVDDSIDAGIKRTNSRGGRGETRTNGADVSESAAADAPTPIFDPRLQDGSTGDDRDDPDEWLTDLEQRVKSLFDSRGPMVDRIDELEQAVNRLEDKLGEGAGVDEDAPPLVHYTNIDADEREDLLSTSDIIAVTIHENWCDIAWKLGNGRSQRFGVDTKTKANAKYNPSKLRYNLKKELGWGPEWNQIYRGLKRLAKLSGGEEEIDEQSGRARVFGGWYRYEERATLDNSDEKRVLWRATE